MNSAERDAILRARLRSLDRRADSLDVLFSIVRGQISAQQREIRVALELLNQPLVIVSAPPLPFPGNPKLTAAA